MVKIAPLCNFNANCINIFFVKMCYLPSSCSSTPPTSSPYTYYIYNLFAPGIYLLAAQGRTQRHTAKIVVK